LRVLRLSPIVCLLLPFSFLFAQSAPPNLEPRPADTAATESSPQMSLDVHVTDKRGAPIRGLQEGDFAVLVDKKPQRIAAFRPAEDESADSPSEITIVVDAVNTPVVAISRARDQLRAFLLQNSGKLPYPVSLVMFSDFGLQVLKAATRDGNALAAQFDQYSSTLRTSHPSQGVYGAEDRFNLSVNTFHQLLDGEKTKPGRKMMVWISPGWPLFSEPGPELSRKMEQELFDQVAIFSAELLQAQVTVYMVDPLGLADAAGLRTGFYKQFVKGVSQPTHTLPGYLGLQVFAVQSGGQVLNSTNDLISMLNACASDAEGFYLLSFNQPPAENPDQYRAIVVKVEKPNVMVRAPAGYYVRPTPLAAKVVNLRGIQD
jgi:VWFA-related protein